MMEKFREFARMRGALLPALFRKMETGQLNPFSRSAEAVDPYAVHRLDEQAMARDFGIDADSAAIAQDPLRARKAIRAVGLFVLIFLLWAAIAQVDEVTRGEGKVIPSRQLQVVQSLDGGIVNEILVKEGETVREGQILLKIDATRFMSNFKESRATYLALLAKGARLRAVAEGAQYIVPPEVLAEDPKLAEEERTLYLNRKAELDAQLGIAREQLTQRNNELREAQARHDQAAQGYELASKELTLTKSLISYGAVSDVEILRLQRDVGRYAGERNQAAAQINRLQSAIGEAQKKIQEVELDFKNQARNEMADVQARSTAWRRVASLVRQGQAGDLRSPVNGTSKRILYNTSAASSAGQGHCELVRSRTTAVSSRAAQGHRFLHPAALQCQATAYDSRSMRPRWNAGTHRSRLGLDGRERFYIVRVRTKRPNLGKTCPSSGLTAQSKS
jgi:adhesin transport system membrane fusion protein